MARIYQGGSAESRYRKTDLGRAYNPQQAGSEEKAAREWKERVIQDGNIKLNDLQREAEAQSLKNSLERKIQAEGLQLQNLSESIELQMDQQYDKGILEQQLLAEQTQLQVDAQNLQNKQALETAALQAQNQVSNAQLGAISTAIEGILSFTNSAFQYADHMFKVEEKKEKDDATIKSGAWAFQSQYDPHSPQTAALVEAENNQALVEIAEETAISNLDIDPIQKEVLRQNVGYGLSDAKVQNQIGVGQASVQINGLLNEAFNDPNRTVTIRDRTTGQLKTIRPMDATSIELDEVLYTLGRNLTQELGLHNADRLKASTQYVPALQNAINNLYNREAAARNAGEKLTRQSQGFTKASYTLQENGVALAWPEYYRAAATSGVYNGDVVATTKAAAKAIVADATPAQLEQLMAGDIRVYENGPTFAKDQRFKGLIQDAIRDKNNGLLTDHRNREKFQEIELSNATNSFHFALMEADSPEATQQAHLAYEAQLQTLANAGNAEARLKLGAELNRNNNYNPSNARALNDRIIAGETFTKEFLTNQLAQDFINNEEYTYLMKVGLATPEAKQNAFGGEKPYNAASNRVKGIVSSTLIKGKGNEFLENGPAEIRTGIVNQLAADIIRRRDASVSDYMSRVENSTGSRPDPGDVLNFADKWLQQNVPDLLNGVTIDENTGTVSGYEYMNQAPAQPIDRRGFSSAYIKNSDGSPYSGINYSDLSPNKLSTIAALGVNINYAGDSILNREEKYEAAKAYVAGEPFSPTVVSKATALGVTPQYLVREQARGIGKELGAYPTQQLPSSFQKMSMSGSGEPTNMYEGAAYLRMMGVPEKGAAYLSGNIQQESSWDGMRDWEGVKNPATGEMDGTSRNGGVVSWASWSGKPARLGRIEAYLGKNISTATHAEQLSAMMWEMQTYYKSAYRVFMNPFATDAQLRRASSEYWGYGYTGDRFVYSQNILKNSTF